MAANTCDNSLANAVGLLRRFCFWESGGVSERPTPHTKHKQTHTHIIFSSFKLFYDSSYIALYSQNLSLIFISPA